MNKLRLIKIYELRKQVHPIEASIIDLLDGIEEEQKNPGWIYYKKNGKIYFSYNPKNNNICLYLLSNIIFKYQKEETIEIMKYLLEKHLKITINIVW